MVVIVCANSSNVVDARPNSVKCMPHRIGRVSTVVLHARETLIWNDEGARAVQREQARASVVRVLIEAQDVPHYSLRE